MEQPMDIEELDKIIENKEKEKSRSPGIVRKILFVLFPAHGWGVRTIYNKKDNKFWLIVISLILLAGIVLGLDILF